MDYFVEFNPDGNIRTFYSRELHGDNIPVSAKPITEEEWILYSADGANTYCLDADGLTIRKKTAQEIAAGLASSTKAETTPEQDRVSELEQLVADLASLLLEV